MLDFWLASGEVRGWAGFWVAVGGRAGILSWWLQDFCVTLHLVQHSNSLCGCSLWVLAFGHSGINCTTFALPQASLNHQRLDFSTGFPRKFTLPTSVSPELFQPFHKCAFLGRLDVSRLRFSKVASSPPRKQGRRFAGSPEAHLRKQWWAPALCWGQQQGQGLSSIRATSQSSTAHGSLCPSLLFRMNPFLSTGTAFELAAGDRGGRAAGMSDPQELVNLEKISSNRGATQTPQ